MSGIQIEIPEIQELIKKVDRLIEGLSYKQQWLTKKQFCSQFGIPERTFQDWRAQGLIVTKKIGNYIFVDLHNSLK